MAEGILVQRSALIKAALLLASLATGRTARAGEDASRADLAFFESKVRPLLATHCQGCHGPDKQKGGLRLDRRDLMIKGGDSGSAVEPGKPDESPLVQAVTYAGDLKMPPKGKLPAGEIAALRHWVALGVPWPDLVSKPAARTPAASSAATPDRPSFTVEEKGFWAFQPPVEPQVPTTKNREWVRSPIDAFVLSGLESRGLSPAPPADRRTLLRRVTFDLTGLPPTREETAAFLSDASPEAYPRLVDRLLASPHYGEKWGRHWLDVARYADSNGMDENLAFANAWRYRDYVVRAFNADLPFDQFLREQVAGDLLPTSGVPARDYDRLTATGFLVIGPKMLAEDDPMKMEMDIVDEQVDTVGKAFLGMTLGCARCHDHKFDPIRTTDYYGLAGIFKSTRTMEHYRVVARWNERPLAAPEDVAERDRYQSQADRKKADIDQVVKKANNALLEEIRRASQEEPPRLPDKPESRYPTPTRERLKALRAELARLEAAVPHLPEAMAVGDREVVDLRVHIRGNHLTLGATVPRRFPLILAGEHQPPLDSTRSGRLELAEWMTHARNPLTSRVVANRLWLWHFGSGIVRSPDNFGRLGERPTHPGLLDWLATRLISDDWSLKALHRLILLSATYQMSTAYDARASGIDPDNRFLWRMNRRRLEAEEVRDTLLAVSGRLEQSMGGSLLKTGNRQYVAGTASVNGTNYHSGRRSVYLPVIRSALFEMFQAFDFSDPSTGSGQRDTTTVAPQALCLMNSDLIQEASLTLAQGVIAEKPRDDRALVAQIYARALGRDPVEREVVRATEFLGKYREALAANSPGAAHGDQDLKACQGLCRVILSSSELLYVD